MARHSVWIINSTIQDSINPWTAQIIDFGGGNNFSEKIFVCNFFGDSLFGCMWCLRLAHISSLSLHIKMTKHQLYGVFREMRNLKFHFLWVGNRNFSQNLYTFLDLVCRDVKLQHWTYRKIRKLGINCFVLFLACRTTTSPTFFVHNSLRGG